MEDYLKDENNLVFSYNHQEYPKPPKYVNDPIEVRNLRGELIGYQWNYGDDIILSIRMQETTLCSDEEHLQLAEIYFENKLVELDFRLNTGTSQYVFVAPASLITRFRFNDREETRVNKNKYILYVTLINPVDNTRTSLFADPLSVYVK